MPPSPAHSLTHRVCVLIAAALATRLEKRVKKIREELEIAGNGEHTQMAHWDERAEDIGYNFNLVNFIKFLQKYSVPLLLGITIALILKNVEDDW